MKTVLAIIIFLLAICTAYAEDDSSLNQYIKVFDDKDINIRANLSRQSFSFNVIDTDNNRRISFSPAVVWNAGFSGNIKNFGFLFSTGTKMGQDEKKGDTDYFDGQMNYFSSGWGMDLYYQRYKGFYLDDSSDRENIQPNGDYVLLPDLKAQYIGFNYYLIINKDFSYRAAFEQVERQEKFAWSFIVMLSGMSYNIDNNGATMLLDEDTTKYYKELAGLEKIKFYGIGPSAGIALTLPLGNFYFTPTAVIGIIPQYQSFETSEGKKDRFMFINLKYNFKIAAGYNGDTFLVGSYFIADVNKTHYKGVDIDLYTLRFSIFMGVRI